MRNFITSAAIFAATVSAIPVWQQCGGQDWKGSGTCDSGSTCVKLNDYYSQCQPGSAPTTTLVTSTRSATTTTSVRTTSGTTTSVRTSSTTTKTGGSTTTAPPTSASGNPFAGKQIYANPYYASEVQSLAIPSLPSSLVAKASAVAKIGSFVWL